MIVHKMLKDGAFVCGDTASRLTCYAYPTSTHATQAKKNPAKVANEMMANEPDWAHASDAIKDYDARNWQTLEG